MLAGSNPAPATSRKAWKPWAFRMSEVRPIPSVGSYPSSYCETAFRVSAGGAGDKPQSRTQAAVTAGTEAVAGL